MVNSTGWPTGLTRNQRGVVGEAEVAECAYTTGTGKRAVTRRLVVRRTRLTDRRQLKLWPDWLHFGFLTDLDGKRAVKEIDGP